MRHSLSETANEAHDTASPTTAVTTASAFPGDARWMEAHWMPFSANRNFKTQGAQNVRMLVGAQGAYVDNHGRRCSTACPFSACGAVAWAMAAPRSPKPWPARSPRWTTPGPFNFWPPAVVRGWPTRSPH